MLYDLHFHHGSVKFIPTGSLSPTVAYKEHIFTGEEGGNATMLSRSNSTHQEKKITRSNLVEQLREYQIRTKHDWASVSLFTPSSNLYTSRYYIYHFRVSLINCFRMDVLFLGLIVYYFV